MICRTIAAIVLLTAASQLDGHIPASDCQVLFVDHYADRANDPRLLAAIANAAAAAFPSDGLGYAPTYVDVVLEYHDLMWEKSAHILVDELTRRRINGQIAEVLDYAAEATNKALGNNQEFDDALEIAKAEAFEQLRGEVDNPFSPLFKEPWPAREMADIKQDAAEAARFLVTKEEAESFLRRDESGGKLKITGPRDFTKERTEVKDSDDVQDGTVGGEGQTNHVVWYLSNALSSWKESRAADLEALEVSDDVVAKLEAEGEMRRQMKLRHSAKRANARLAIAEEELHSRLLRRRAERYLEALRRDDTDSVESGGRTIEPDGGVRSPRGTLGGQVPAGRDLGTDKPSDEPDNSESSENTRPGGANDAAEGPDNHRWWPAIAGVAICVAVALAIVGRTRRRARREGGSDA